MAVKQVENKEQALAEMFEDFLNIFGFNKPAEETSKEQEIEKDNE